MVRPAWQSAHTTTVWWLRLYTGSIVPSQIGQGGMGAGSGSLKTARKAIVFAIGRHCPTVYVGRYRPDPVAQCHIRLTRKAVSKTDTLCLVSDTTASELYEKRGNSALIPLVRGVL